MNSIRRVFTTFVEVVSISFVEVSINGEFAIEIQAKKTQKIEIQKVDKLNKSEITNSIPEICILDTELELIKNCTLESPNAGMSGLLAGSKISLPEKDVLFIAKTFLDHKGSDSNTSPQRKIEEFIRKNPGMAHIGVWREHTEEAIKPGENAIEEAIGIIKDKDNPTTEFIEILIFSKDDEAAVESFYINEKLPDFRKIDLNVIGRKEAIELFAASMQGKRKTPEKVRETRKQLIVAGSNTRNRLEREIIRIRQLPGIEKCSLTDIDKDNRIIHLEIKNRGKTYVLSLACASNYPIAPPALFIDKRGKDFFTSKIIKRWHQTYEVRDIVLEFMGFLENSPSERPFEQPKDKKMGRKQVAAGGPNEFDYKKDEFSGGINKILLAVTAVTSILLVVFFFLFFREWNRNRNIRASAPVTNATVSPGRKHSPADSGKIETEVVVKPPKPDPSASKAGRSPTPTLRPPVSGRRIKRIQLARGDNLLLVSPKFSGREYQVAEDILGKYTPWTLLHRDLPGLSYARKIVHLDNGNDEKAAIQDIEKTLDKKDVGIIIIFTYKVSKNQKRLVDKLISAAGKKNVPFLVVSLKDSDDKKDRAYFGDVQHFISLYRKAPVNETNFRSKINDELKARITIKKK